MSRARSLARLGNENVFSVDTNNNVGVNSLTPLEKLNVVGVVSATSFFGDGSNLEGINASGLGTALSDTGAGAVIYYTNKTLVVDDDITIDVPSTANAAYTQYSEVAIDDSKDLIVAEGDDFIPDILGLSTEGVTPMSGAGGRIRANNFSDFAGTGAPTFQTGLNVTGNLDVTGVLTYEDVTSVDSIGVVTARSTIDAQGDVSIADKIIHTGDTDTAIRFPAADTFTVETAGTERVRVDSSGRVGINTTPGSPLEVNGGSAVDVATFNSHHADGPLINIQRSGTNIGFVGSGENLHSSTGSVDALAVRSQAEFTIATGGSTERLRITSTGAAIFKAGTAEKYQGGNTLAAASNAVALSSGNVARFTANESGNQTVNFTGVHDTLSNGENISFTVIITPNGSGAINAVQIDGVAQSTLKWSGGSAPSAGSSGEDVYTFTIFKTGTGTTDYAILGAATNYA